MRIKTIRSVPFILALSIILAFSAFAAGEPVILSQPQNYYFPAGTALPATASFAVLAQGDGDLSYQWQVKDSGGWRNASGGTAQTANYTLPIYSVGINGGYLFRVVISNESGSVTSQAVSAEVGAYVLDSLPQLLSYVTDTGNAIFDWVGQACTAIVSEPFLLFTVGFLALGGCVAIVGRLLSRS